MSGPSAAGMPPPIQTDWRVQPQPAQPQPPIVVPPQTGGETSRPQVYGPVLDSTSQVGSYARDDFQQYRFPDSDGSQFAPQPLGEAIEDRVKEFVKDKPVIAGAAVAGAMAAAGEGKVKVDRDVTIGGVRGTVEFRGEYDRNRHMTDPATGNRFSAGPEVSGGVTLRIPLGGGSRD